MPHFYLDEEGQLNYNADEKSDGIGCEPLESAFTSLILKGEDDSSQVLIFKDNEGKLDLAPGGKADWGILDNKASPEKQIRLKNDFLEFVAEAGLETPRNAARRELIEELVIDICGSIKMKQRREIITAPHIWWGAETIPTASKIVFFSYSITHKELAALQTRKLEQFPGGVALAELKEVDGVPQLLFEGVNLLEDLSQLRFNGMERYSHDVFAFFSTILAEARLQKLKSFAGTGYELLSSPKPCLIIDDTDTLGNNLNI